MYRSVDDEEHNRSVFYSGYIPGVLDPSDAWFISPIPGNGGYGTIAVGPGDSLAVATYHYVKPAAIGHTVVDARFRTPISRQGGIFTYSFPLYDYPSGDTIMPKILTCQGIKTGLDTLEGGYMWPSIAADHDPVSNKTIAHVLAKESAPSYIDGTVTTYVDTTGKASLVYYKTLPDLASPGATCGFLLDSISSNICYDIVASPVSQKVAAVYLYPKVWTGYEVGDNDDVVYKESDNLGGSWGERTLIHAFDSKDSIDYSFERPEELSALYDADDCLHVLYETYWAGINPADLGHYYYFLPCRIYHWNSCDPACHVMLKDGRAKEDKVAESPGAWYSAAGRPPLGQHLMSKISLTQCTVGGTERLYAVYTLYPDSSGIEGNTHTDRSTTPILNGDIVVQGSTDITGSLWGPVVNITNTRSNGCSGVLADCFSEQYTNAAPYTNDSMRIQYLLDKDAGSAIQGSTANPQGVVTDNPMVIKSHPCYAVALEAILTVTPTELRYPLHAVKGASLTRNLLLVNEGNDPAIWSATVAGTAPVSLVPSSGTVQAGCVNSAEIIATIGPKSTEGLFKSTVTFGYQVGKTLTFPIDFYVFDSWFLPQDVAIRTANNKMMVNQAGQAGDDVAGVSWTYFAAPDTDYITDASLIIGNAADNLSWLLFTNEPTVDNNFGKLYALSNTTYDTTTFLSYRVAYGKGTNRDSTIGFDVRWYAATFVDSADFYVGHFEVYKGSNDPSGTVTGVDIAFGCDWDVPSDTGSDNTIHIDEARQMIYLQGEYSATRQQGYGALAAYLEKTVPPDSTLGDQLFDPIAGGFAWGNTQQVYDQSGYLADSVWKYVEATDGYSSLWSVGDSIGDMSIVMVVAKNYSVTPTSRLKFDIVLAGKRAETNPSGLAGLNLAVDQAKAFITNRGRCSACGDANSDGSVDISDVVYLIAHIFSGGTAPRWCDYIKGKGDANGDGAVDISDAVYLIARIFSGGKAPHCQGK
jgi:hypothetical protein